jgi:LysR family transcriptional regulator, regulator for bpeEF and oprC
MRLDQLAAMRLFVRIVETGSFAKAARALGMSSSNATERMAKLEEALGARLLARTTRAVAPTFAGARYLDAFAAWITEALENARPDPPSFGQDE